MSEQRIPLTALSQKRLAELEMQITAFSRVREAIITGIIDHAGVEVTKEHSVSVEPDAIVVTTPDTE